MNRVSLQDHDAKLASIQAQKQALAQAVLARDSVALKKWEALDAEAALLRRRVELEAMAALEAAKQQAEQEAAAIQQDRKRREEAAKQEASVILDADKEIDAALATLHEHFMRRRQAVNALQVTRVVAPTMISRLVRRQTATRAFDAAGLRDFVELQAVMPQHRATLTDIDKWLSGPLTIVDEAIPAEAGSKMNGADHAS